MIPAEFFDVSRHCPDANPPKAKLNNDVLWICAGWGMNMDARLPGYVSLANSLNMPYFTYHIPVDEVYGGVSVELQAETYLSWPGVDGHVQVADIEPPYLKYPQSQINAEQAKRYMNRLAIPWSYSSKPYLDKISWPAFLCDYPMIFAQYPREPWKFREYQEYEPFQRDYPAGTLPRYADTSIYKNNLIAWQFSAHMLGEKYFADTPFSGDGNVSLIERAEFVSMIARDGMPPPIEPPPTEVIMQKYQIVEDYLRIRTGHSTSGTSTIRQMRTGEIVTGTGATYIANAGEVWAEIEDASGNKGWCAVMYYGGRVMAKTVE